MNKGSGFRFRASNVLFLMNQNFLDVKCFKVNKNQNISLILIFKFLFDCFWSKLFSLTLKYKTWEIAFCFLFYATSLHILSSVAYCFFRMFCATYNFIGTAFLVLKNVKNFENVCGFFNFFCLELISSHIIELCCCWIHFFLFMIEFTMFFFLWFTFVLCFDYKRSLSYILHLFSFWKTGTQKQKSLLFPWDLI